ncbi:MAG: hypothetical protein RR364_05755 [Lachnospiraceae bacterium]
MDESWEKFQKTGQITDYLSYKNQASYGITMGLEPEEKNKVQGAEKDEGKTDGDGNGDFSRSHGRF